MKKYLLLVLLSVLSCSGFAQNAPVVTPPQVDPRVELLSVVFRLAGRMEYTSRMYLVYADRIDRHFGKYKDHELIQFVRSIMDERGLGYDAVMSMAVHLDDKMNLIGTVGDSSWDARWRCEDVAKFIPLLKKFRKETDFDRFYKENEDIYALAEERMKSVYEQFDLSWYTTFYGKAPSDTFRIVLGLGNGGNNYGPSVMLNEGKREVYAVLGAWQFDAEGTPLYPGEEYLPILLHEFNHSFVNWLTEKHREALQPAGEQLFAIQNEEMCRQAYTDWNTMLSESLVRASVIKYMIDHQFDQQQIDNAIKTEMERGFVWMKGVVSELKKYDAQRTLYPSLSDYMPELAKVYDNYVQTLQTYEVQRPRVVSIDEFENGAAEVDANIRTITVRFDRTLRGQGYSVFYGSKGQSAFPKVGHIGYVDGNRAVVMEVVLEPGMEYQFVLTGRRFVSAGGVPMKNYEVNFKTVK